MKKFALVLLALILLAALCACDDGECRHKNMQTETFAPDCSLEGYVLHTCPDCGHTYKSDIAEPLGHTIEVTVTEPTCTAAGFTHYECACGYAYDSDFVVPEGHRYTSTITEPTCLEGGHTEFACAVCAYTYKAKWTVPNGHSLVATTVDATCTEAGYTEYACANCDYSYQTNITSPVHTFKSVKYPPTIGTTGYTEYICTVCSYSYQTDHVWYSDIFMGAAGEGKGVLAEGLDLSAWNKNVDFEAIKAAGVDFVILRAGTGYSGKDILFDEYYAAAKAAGLDVGCYYYSYATTVNEALAEAQAFKSYIAGKQFEYPVYFDLEDASQKDLGQTLLMDMCFAFCDSLIAGGYFPGIYCNSNWAEEILHTEKLITLYDVWIARYNNSLPKNYYDDDYGMWQYTEDGTCAGVTGVCDRNYCYKDYPTHIKNYGLNGYGD